MINKTKKAPVQEFFLVGKNNKVSCATAEITRLCSEMLKPFMAQILPGVATFCHALFDLLAQSSQVLGDSLDGSRIIYGEKWYCIFFSEMVVQKNQKEAASIEKAQTLHAEKEQEGNQSALLFAIEVGEGSESQVLN